MKLKIFILILLLIPSVYAENIVLSSDELKFTRTECKDVRVYSENATINKKVSIITYGINYPNGIESHTLVDIIPTAFTVYSSGVSTPVTICSKLKDIPVGIYKTEVIFKTDDQLQRLIVTLDNTGMIDTILSNIDSISNWLYAPINDTFARIHVVVIGLLLLVGQYLFKY